jgi:arylsulfatase A
MLVGLCAACSTRSAFADEVRGAESDGRPNVVLIMADDFGYECLGCNGSLDYRTPQLDELARTGARFTNCHSQPLCTPTRVEIMTGRYFFRNYVRFGTLKQGERTFGNMLKAAGYATAVAGKWQLDGGGGQTPEQAGFDEYCLWNIQFGELGAKGDRYADPNLLLLDPATGKPLAETFHGKYGPDVCCDYLLDFIERSAKADKPFFAYYPMILTHGPFLPTPRSDVWENGNRKAGSNRYFKDMVESMDEIVGRIVARLDQLGLRESTLILFTGDNGTPGGIQTRVEGGRIVDGGKGLSRDTGTHVPLIVNWPGKVKPEQVRDELVDASDFLPTIAEAAGAELPKPPGDGVIDGRSFLPAALGKPYDARQWVFIDYTEPRQDSFGWPRARLVRDARYKLYGFYQRKDKKSGDAVVKTGQLYDTLADPDELHPLEVGERGGELDRIRQRLQDVLDGMPQWKPR